ncbi:hypothetical protein [Frankia sp. AgB32]|uniref:hypothetical protein n=1 Tax=Frankia sp. AgB32 TaxID=631119 RepID=UPI002010913F|nr:hypothetical protein [Frankia sp. AgB32]MCK9898336.1 hypothetical protein [Frankia sp. AgB32]
MSNLGDAVMDMLDQLVDKALGGQPVRSDGKAVNEVVYSQLRTGRPIDIREFADPWSPAGGSTLQAAVPAGTTPTPAAPPPAAASVVDGSASAAAPTPAAMP